MTKMQTVEGDANEVQPVVAEVTMISLADICSEMGIKPQSARVKLRKVLKGTKEKGFRWSFPVEQKDEIIDLLTKKAKAKPAEADAEENDAEENDAEENDAEENDAEENDAE